MAWRGDASGDRSPPVLVLELVEGLTLDDLIRREGALPVRRSLEIAGQLADAVDGAHEQGGIHRDLKPANIKVRDDGRVKVLDFGLAKALGARTTSESDNDLANSPTVTSPAVTETGVILGTAAYMSPEQAKGRAVDKRADVWGFGCVLFEMLTGHRVFEGPSVTETIARVLEREPDWSTLPPDTPPILQAAAALSRERSSPAAARHRRREDGD